MAAMALWHSAGIFSSSGGSGSWSTLLACVLVCVVVPFGSGVVCVSVFDLGSMLLAAFLSLVMRFSCLVSDFGMGGCIFVVVSREEGWAIGRIV